MGLAPHFTIFYNICCQIQDIHQTKDKLTGGHNMSRVMEIYVVPIASKSFHLFILIVSLAYQQKMSSRFYLSPVCNEYYE